MIIISTAIFTIDSNYLKNTVLFDREELEFSTQKVPQIQIIFDLQCNENASQLIQPWLASDILTDEILFNAQRTYLNIIVEDVNDNPPVFTNPHMANYKIGYPEESLVERLLPPYLIKIGATDADEGINAKIKFSINPSTYFDINPENGEVYPKRKFTEPTTLTVTATDKDGAADGISSSITLNVMKLTSGSIIQMTVFNFNENLEDFIYDLSEAVDLDIQLISHAPIPNDIESAAKQLSDFYDAKLIIYAYAFGSNGDLIKAQDLIDALFSVGANIQFSLIETDDEAPYCESPSYAGWIAAVVVLAILLVIVITAPLVYFFWFKKRVDEPEQRRVSESSSSKEIQENFYSEPGQSTPLPNTEVESQTSATVTTEDELVGGQVDEISEGKFLNL